MTDYGPDVIAFKLEKARRAKARRERANAKPRTNGDVHPDTALQGDVLPPELHGYHLTEDGVALAFTARHGSELRFSHGPNHWHRWDGTRWKPEPTRIAFDWCRTIARSMGNGTDSAKTREMLGKATFASGVERFAQADRMHAVTPDLFDTDPWLLGTPGGTVDLRSAALHPPNPNDYISKQTTVTPAEPGTPHPIWNEFLDFITCENRELRRFLQQIAGYALTGDVWEECLFFIYGHGMNGKGTCVGTLANILGDYAVSADMQTFTLSKYDRHPAEIAKLAGARLVTASETERGRSWAWSRIKELTGNERTISARYMRQNFFEFIATFKLLFAGNHKPRLPSADEATARRMRLIPFRNKPRVPDFGLKVKLVAEYPAILRWAIDGCLDWQQHRLVVPQIVTDATSDYLEEQDLFAQWIDDECTTVLTDFDTHAALFGSWSRWCIAHGEQGGSSAEWRERMVEAGFQPIRHTPGRHGQRGWRGVAVRRPDPADWTDPS